MYVCAQFVLLPPVALFDYRCCCCTFSGLTICVLTDFSNGSASYSGNVLFYDFLKIYYQKKWV